MHADTAEKRLIFDTVTGSQAYGTNHKDSDVDTVAICIPTEEYFYSSSRFEQVVYKNGQDRVIYDLRKAVGLMADNNPNMLDLLFAPERCVRKITPYWERVIDIRDKFISKRCRHTFSGYATAQLERIKVHRGFLFNPPAGAPERADFGLPERSVFPVTQIDAIITLAADFFDPETKSEMVDELKRIHSSEIMPLLKKNLVPEYKAVAMDYFKKGLKAQIQSIKSLSNQYINDEHKEMALNELRYGSALKVWKRYLEWKKNRNKKRAYLEEKFGFDLKHAVHLVRLMRMGKEILETGKVNVDRTNIDAEELKEIGSGAWSYDQLEEYSKNMDSQLDNLYKISKLQHSPDRGAVTALCIELVKEYLNKE